MTASYWVGIYDYTGPNGSKLKYSNSGRRFTISEQDKAADYHRLLQKACNSISQEAVLLHVHDKEDEIEVQSFDS